MLFSNLHLLQIIFTLQELTDQFPKGCFLAGGTWVLQLLLIILCALLLYLSAETSTKKYPLAIKTLIKQTRGERVKPRICGVFYLPYSQAEGERLAILAVLTFMPIKDYYRTLGVPASASLQEVKKAFRALAHLYHPDKQTGPDNSFATGHFKEIQEAYSVLSDEKKRKIYDEERYFAGLSSKREPASINGSWILIQAKRLSSHMAHVDSYRMSHTALYEYVLLLLSESHLAVLQHENDSAANKAMVVEVLSSIKNIEYRYFQVLAARLSTLAGTQNEIHQLIYLAEQNRKRDAKHQQLLPIVIVIISLLLCLLMYLYNRGMF